MLDLNEEEWLRMARAAHVRLERVCFGEAPQGVTAAACEELNDAGTLFIDRLMSAACALAAHRHRCTEKNFKQARAEITAEDVQYAWEFLHE